MTGPSWLTTTIVAAVVAGCVAGCGPPDRRADAQRLQDVMAALPGVSSAQVSYHNEDDHGVGINIYAFVPDATRDQIRDLVARINTVRADRFASYGQNAMFAVTSDRRTSLSRLAELDPDQIADDAMRLREVASAISADQISWFRHDSNSVLDMRDVRTPTASILPALVAEVASTDVKVSVGRGIPPPPWGANFPFTPADQQHLEQRIGGLPVVVRAVGATGASMIVAVDVAVAGPERAEADLLTTINSLGPADPIVLTWTVDHTAGWQGSVVVNGCSDAAGTTSSPDGAALQTAIRARFERCKPR